MRLPQLDELRSAAALVRRTLPGTPQIRWPLLCRHAGAEVWVKHENHNPTGAFKVRGGLYYMHRFRRREGDAAGVVSATRGNHGQSLAFAAGSHGIPVVIVVPHGNSREKNAAMIALGAELVEHGRDFTAAAEHARALAARRSLALVPSFHRELLLGVASYWLEFFDACPDLHTAYVPIGLGSGLCAGIAVRDALGLDTRLVGVVASAAPAYALSWRAGEVVSHPATTAIADGIAVRRPDPQALTLIRDGAERIVEVDDEEVRVAMRLYFTASHNLAEGAGAAPLAALLQERERMRGRKIGLILCGANVDREVFTQVLGENDRDG